MQHYLNFEDIEAILSGQKLTPPISSKTQTYCILLALSLA